ncbi:MAG: TrpB-like pyridoxal-phosphate dependent enzyme, partial [Desulfobacterales bacterium]|nr:TrpB-like pyridoxal-phosphate dependent enzyme [Desulfobacterales bacterium]
LVSQLVMSNLVRPAAVQQMETFQAGITFARTEGFISAPETDHAIAVVIQEALKAKEEGKEKVILFNWSGHGLIDMNAYEAYLAGQLEDYALSEEELTRALGQLEGLPKPKQYVPAK